MYVGIGLRVKQRMLPSGSMVVPRLLLESGDLLLLETGDNIIL